MVKKESSNVFPLHLTPLDAFFCAEDHPAYPMTSVIHLDFSGTLDPELFEAALDDALNRHPLLSALIRPAKRSMPCWVPTRLRPRMDWGSCDEPIACPEGEAIDLSREVGLRVWGRIGDNAARLTLQVHHACTDGTGVYRFLGDLLACYGIRAAKGAGGVTGKDVPELGEVDPRLLRGRRRRMGDVAFHGTRAQFMRAGFRQCWDVFGKRIQPIAVPTQGGGSQRVLTPFPGVFSKTFSREQHKLLRAAAGKYGAMLNDLLLAEMFQTIRQWNQQLAGRPPQGWLRIMMPYDLRDKQDYEMPAANMTAYTFITRRSRDCAHLETLVRDVREETARIKHGRLGTSFVDALMLAEYGPKILEFLLRRDRCMSTVILSNIGEPSRRFTARLPRKGGKIRCGNLVLEQITGVPPLRRKSHATFAIFTYARELTISLRCNPYCFTMEQCEALLDMYMQRLARHLT
jgi:hypothetical protein